MFVRDVLAERFVDLENGEDRDSFCYLMLSLPRYKAWLILTEQYRIAPGSDAPNLVLLKNHLSRYPAAYKKTAGFQALSELLELVLQTDKLTRCQYSELKTASLRQQFVLGLLMANDIQRNEILRSQRGNVNNICEIMTDLKNVPPQIQGIYYQFPTYASLANDLVAMAEFFQKTNNTALPLMPVEDLKLMASLKAYVEEEDLLSDSIFNVELKNPVITPQGTTYERSQIMREINTRQKDPNDRSPLHPGDLLTNHLVIKMKELLEMPIIPITQLYEAMLCPLSHELLVDPVVAQNGHTYSRVYLQAYLEEHENHLPDGMIQIKPLHHDKYINRFIRSVLEEPRKPVIEWLIEYCQKEKYKKMSAALISFDKSISLYKAMRIKEPRYAGYRFGDVKMDKLAQATLFSRLLDGDESWESFNQKANQKVLGRGRLGRIYKPAVEEYVKHNGLKK